ncbi:hypothetical protein QBC37DRAFT_427856 [Rhypophila decipiens]|uniref:Uncharacterized protein n=1 Tax=Rhypophila decipiens TaxID=261697 RepID=A0AAN7B5G1_9PEZI|nr:hypothetical protein QBC37DRAFT_427856 [Rhypophila decipiens]
MPASDLTESDRRFLEVAITCLKEPPQLDVPRIAEILGIKNKSVTNKWWEIKKKLWGVEVARAAGEKTRQLATAAGVKRKREAKAANPAPPKPVKEPVRWYTNDVAPLPTTPTSAAPANDIASSSAVAAVAGPIVDGVATAMEIDGASRSPDERSAVPSDGDGDGVAYAAAAADVTSTMDATTTMEPIAPTSEEEIPTTEADDNSEPEPAEHADDQQVGPTDNGEVAGHASDGDEVGGHVSDGEEIGGHASDGEEAGVV